jgi:hypothetical protein
LVAAGALPEVDSSIDRLVDEYIETQKKTAEGLRELFNVSFSVILEYNNREVSACMDDYLSKLSILRPELEKQLRETVRLSLLERL